MSHRFDPPPWSKAWSQLLTHKDRFQHFGGFSCCLMTLRHLLNVHHSWIISTLMLIFLLLICFLVSSVSFCSPKGPIKFNLILQAFIFLISFSVTLQQFWKAPCELLLIWLRGPNWNFTRWYTWLSCWTKLWITVWQSTPHLLKLPLDVSKDRQIETVNLFECVTSCTASQRRLHSDYSSLTDEKR